MCHGIFCLFLNSGLRKDVCGFLEETLGGNSSKYSAWSKRKFRNQENGGYGCSVPFAGLETQRREHGRPQLSKREDFSPQWDSVVRSGVARETVWCFSIYSSMVSTKVQVTHEFANSSFKHLIFLFTALGMESPKLLSSCKVKPSQQPCKGCLKLSRGRRLWCSFHTPGSCCSSLQVLVVFCKWKLRGNL